MTFSHQRDSPEDLAEMVAWVESVATPGCRILDVGCGDGSVVAALSDRYDVWGVDPHAEPRERVVAARVEDFDAAPFDVVYASLSLHHLPDLDAAAKALRRLTHVGSTVVVREFDRALLDETTLRWWFHQRQALEVTHPPDHDDHTLPDGFDEFRDVLFAMLREHVHPWDDVRGALDAAGIAESASWSAPHLVRWGLLESLRPTEEMLIREGRLRAIGVRWLGRPVAR